MMPASRGRGLGAADEGGWGVIYSKLNRGLSWKPTNRKNVIDLSFDQPLRPLFCFLLLLNVTNLLAL